MRELTLKCTLNVAEREGGRKGEREGGREDKGWGIETMKARTTCLYVLEQHVCLGFLLPLPLLCRCECLSLFAGSGHIQTTAAAAAAAAQYLYYRGHLSLLHHNVVQSPA